MTFSAPHHLLSFGGSLPGAETWTMGLRLTGVVAAAATSEDALLDLYAAALGTAWNSFAIPSSAVMLQWAKLNKIGLDGKYLNQYTNIHEYPSNGVAGGGGAVRYPNQVSMVVSLTTGFARGLAHAGRLYFPLPAFSIVAADGIISVLDQDTAVAGAKVFLDAINNAGDGSIIIASKERAGSQHTVTGLRIGRVLDTMRSRRTSLDEGYTAAILDPTGFEGDGGTF